MSRSLDVAPDSVSHLLGDAYPIVVLPNIVKMMLCDLVLPCASEQCNDRGPEGVIHPVCIRTGVVSGTTEWYEVVGKRGDG